MRKNCNHSDHSVSTNLADVGSEWVIKWGSTEKDKAFRQIHTLSQKDYAIYELQHCFFGGSVGGAGIIVPLPPPYPCRSDPTCLFDTDL